MPSWARMARQRSEANVHCEAFYLSSKPILNSVVHRGRILADCASHDVVGILLMKCLKSPLKACASIAYHVIVISRFEYNTAKPPLRTSQR
jgi:hypothetical protein